MQLIAPSKPKCQKGSQHQQQHIIMICLNKQCEAKRLCCLVCIDQLHQKHQLISIKKFQSLIKQTIFFNTTNKEKQIIIKILKKYQELLNKKLDDVEKLLNNYINQIRKQTNAKFKDMYQTFQLDSWSNLQHQNLYENITNQMISEYYNKIQNMESQRFVTPQQTSKKIQQFDKVLDKALVQANKHIKNAHQSIQRYTDKMKFGSNIATKLVYNKFSNDYKASGLVLTQDSTHVQKQQNPSQGLFSGGGYPIALLQQPLSEANDNASFMLLEQPGNHACWLGIASLDFVKVNAFKNCYGLGKGTYAIDQVGVNHSSAYSWSHHDMQYNSKPKVGWTFNVGDVINVRIDFMNSKVIFSKGLQTYEQPIKLDLGKFYAFAGPTNTGDKFKVVNS